MVNDLLPLLYERDNDLKLKAEWEEFIQSGLRF
jgi:hypothetical protein